MDIIKRQISALRGFGPKKTQIRFAGWKQMKATRRTKYSLWVRHSFRALGRGGGVVIVGSPVCRHCGARIDGPPYVQAGEEFCCEGCFLKAIQLDAGETVDGAHQMLAEALAKALDIREQETGLHSKRVACHTLVLARRFTNDRTKLWQIYWGALLHDVGKIGIPDAILLKSGPLTEAEQLVMRTHPDKGHAILAGIPFLKDAAQIVLSHEERFDGSGYPRGLAGEAIPFGARIFAVIDTLDAMTSDRPYRRGLPFDAAKAEILRFAGTQFDPAAVEAFVAEERVLREMVAVKCATAWTGEPG